MSVSARGLCRAFCLGLALVFAGGSSLSAQERKVPESQEEMLLSFSPAVKQVAPAVVNVFTRTVVERKVSPLFDDPFFKRFFGEAFGDFGKPRKREENSLGSGVLVSADGYVVTNHHVIENAAEIRVVLSDRRDLPARLVLDDPDTDLAVLKIESDEGDLPFLKFKDSDSLEVGDLVLAVGNPFGVGQTVTSGIVSALARTQVGVSDYNFFVQTDAAINPGNSGGALVTLDGGLIGINTAIYSRTGGSIGIGFAIPSNMVATVVQAALTGGEVMRPWAGVTGQTVTPDLAEGFGLDRPGGVLVNEVFPGGPADKAGIEVGDVVLGIDEKMVVDAQALRFRLATLGTQGKARLDVWRDRMPVVLELPLELPPETPLRDQTLLSGRQPLAGGTVANLSPALAEEIEMPGAWSGVVILEVESGSFARRFGFRPGDILVGINGETIVDVAQLRQALATTQERWRIAVNRGGRVRNLDISG